MSESVHYENGSNDVSVEKFFGNSSSSEKLRQGFSSKLKFVKKISSQFYYFCILLLLIFFLIFMVLVFPRHVTVINHNYYASTNYTTALLQPALKSNLTSPLPSLSLDSTNYTTTFLPLQFSEEDSTNESPYNYKLFLSDAYQLRIYDLKTNKSSLYYEVSQEITSFDVIKSSVFFIEKNISLIQSLNISHENVTIYSHVTPYAIAIDSLTKNIYILDKSDGTINVMDFEGKYFGIMLSGIEELHDIVLDVEAGYMFILQYQKSILRINLDGTNVHEIVKDNKITAITIDRKRKHILWADTDLKILKIDYNGKKRGIIIAVSSSRFINSLAYQENRLFWIESSSHHVLWECEYSHEMCINHKNLPMLYNNITAIKIFLDWDVNENRIYNPCLENNGNCSHFCLLRPDKRRTCACATGYQLDSDLQSCKLDTRDFILYSTSRYLRGIVVDTTDRDTFRNVIVPNPNGRGLKDFYYDVENDQFYLQYYDKVKAMSIKKENKVKTVIDKYTSKIVFDWASKNFYYNWQGNIWLYNNNLNKQITTSGRILDMVVDVRGGRLNFFTKNYYIYYCSSNLDGSSFVQTSLYSRYYSHYDRIRLVFDPDANKTYYITKSDNNLYSIVDSNENYYLPVNEVTKDGSYLPSFYGEYLYMRNYSGIWRVNKSNFSGEVTLVALSLGDEKIEQMKVFKRAIDYSDGTENDCAVNNGGCEHFCFSRPTKYCGCADNYKLSSDDKSCIIS